MKKAFTLIELMVVVAIIATLLAIVFRIAGVGSDASYRNITLQRLQRMENALSGYYAAFGSYPPVALCAKRNVYTQVDENGNQRDSGETGSLEWNSVKAACRAQPVAVRFPFARTDAARTYVETVAKIVVERLNSNDEQFADWKNYPEVARVLGGGFTPLNSPNQVNGWNTKTSWQEVKVFQFGVMSFLLPRYLFMTAGLEENDLEDCAQWNANNRLSAHPNTGETFPSWEDQLKDVRLLRRIPSQAVCARWMPNFEKMLHMNPFSTSPRIFGIDVMGGLALQLPDKAPPLQLVEDVYVDQSRTILDKITVLDGWDREFYYYSAPPFQSYRLWSAGANGKTFPPWVPLDTLKSDADRKNAAAWMEDDIAYLSN